MPDLDWTLSVPLRRSWAEVCRWITSLAGGSSCRGNVGWLDVAPSIQLSVRLKRHLKWCATAIRVVITFLSVSARRSVELDDDKVVSEYEEDWPEGRIGSDIRVSCPSYLGPSWQERGRELVRERGEMEREKKECQAMKGRERGRGEVRKGAREGKRESENKGGEEDRLEWWWNSEREKERWRSISQDKWWERERVGGIASVEDRRREKRGKWEEESGRIRRCTCADRQEVQNKVEICQVWILWNYLLL